jgi:hypothetical protein
MTNLNKALAGVKTGLLLAVASTTVAAASIPSPRHVEAYTFDWLGQPYLRDYYGNYAYRDIFLSWSNWDGSGYSGLANPGSYVNFATTSYSYYSFGATADSAAPGTGLWDGGAQYLDYYNTPRWTYANVGHAIKGNTEVFFHHCAGQNCASPGLYTVYGSGFWAQIPGYATTANCVSKQTPVYYGC